MNPVRHTSEEDRAVGHLEGSLASRFQPEPLQGWGCSANESSREGFHCSPSQEGKVQPGAAVAAAAVSATIRKVLGGLDRASGIPLGSPAAGPVAAEPSENIKLSEPKPSAVRCPITGSLRLAELPLRGETQSLQDLIKMDNAADGVDVIQLTSSEHVGVLRSRVFDWNHAGLLGGERFDVLLACDVLYEDSAVKPIASLVPR